MAPNSVEKAAFITNRGLFEPLVMFFGLCNAPATFQMMMDCYDYTWVVVSKQLLINIDNCLIGVIRLVLLFALVIWVV